MSKKIERGFIKISQVVGDTKVIGSLSIWQTLLIIVVILLIYGLVSWLKIGLFKSLLLGTWILGSILVVTGTRPDRIIRRLLGKPKRWRRGFHPARPLLEKRVVTKD